MYTILVLYVYHTCIVCIPYLYCINQCASMWLGTFPTLQASTHVETTILSLATTQNGPHLLALNMQAQASLYSNGILILCLPGWIVCISQDRNKETYRPGVREAREVYSLFQLPADSYGQPVHVWQVAELQNIMRWGDPSLLTRDYRMRYVQRLVCCSAVLVVFWCVLWFRN
jgi:hypothetical protein